jgi:hypothetical protein
MTSAPNVGGDRGLVVRQQGALGHELIAAGLLMLAGPTDLDELDRWMHVSWQRRCGAAVPFGTATIRADVPRRQDGSQ